MSSSTSNPCSVHDIQLNDVLCVDQVADSAINSFAQDGFYIFPNCVFRAGREGVAAAVRALEDILNGIYETGKPPTKLPAGFHQNHQQAAGSSARRFVIGSSCRVNPGGKGDAYVDDMPSSSATTTTTPSIVVRKSIATTLQIINAHISSKFLDAVCQSPSLGQAVCRLCKWPGCRLAQDQAWLKPPGSGPLSFHRDTTYFDFVPKEVCTVWFAFDDLLDAAMGPLEYCAGSHLWGEHRRGSANQFFDENYRALCEDAAKLEKHSHGEESGGDFSLLLRYVQVKLSAGGCSIHDGRTWHGSGPNSSNQQYRKGFGIHFIRSDAVFQSHEPLGKLWKPYKKGGAESSDFSLPDEFPITFQVSSTQD